MFNDLPSIELGCEPVSAMHPSADRLRSGWDSSTSPSHLEAFHASSARMSPPSWVPQKVWDDRDDMRFSLVEQDRSFGHELPPWRPGLVRQDFTWNFPSPANPHRSASWSIPIAPPSYIPPGFGERMVSVSEQSSSSGGSTWSPEPSEDRFEFEAGDAHSRQNYGPNCRSRSTYSDGTFSQPYTVQSGGCFSETSSFPHPSSDSGITLQDVQQYPDTTYPEDYDSKVLREDHGSQDTCPLKDLGTPRLPPIMSCDDQHTYASTPSPREGSAPPYILDDEELTVKVDTTSDGDNDSGSDYTPSTRKAHGHNIRNTRIPRGHQKGTQTPKGRSGKTKNKNGQRSSINGIVKRPSKVTQVANAVTVSAAGKDPATTCSQCSITLQTKSALKKHISTSHTRPFTCTFRLYGCPATFGSKNEWKRHVSSQHLRLGIWRCDLGACLPQQNLPSPVPEKSSRKARTIPVKVEIEELVFNDFNRKDLFTQHLRRMHAPPESSSQAEQEKFTASLLLASKRCLKNTREPPPYSVCGYCNHEDTNQGGGVFQGSGSWEIRMEHVGRHLESGHGETQNWHEDTVLRGWMADEGLIEEAAGGAWRLVGLQNGDDKGKRARQ